METAYVDSDFREMTYDVSKMKDGKSYLEAFPELKNYEGFNIKGIKGMLNKDTMFRYVAMVYDKHSPYVRSFPSQTKRKKQVAKDLGLIKATIPENIQQVFLGENIQVNGMIIEYSILQFDNDWATICTYHDKIFQSLYLLRNSTEIDKDLNAAIILWNKEVDAIKDKMLLEDTSRALNEQLLKRVMDSNLGVTPEENAKINQER